MPKFRETAWFKRGELVEEVPDEARVDLPLEDRYLDEGQTTQTDSVLYGVHTGETRPIPFARILFDHAGASADPDPVFASTVIAVDPQSAPELLALVRELKARNRALMAMCGAAVLVVAVFVSNVL